MELRARRTAPSGKAKPSRVVRIVFFSVSIRAAQAAPRKPSGARSKARRERR
jgi:hypothetical protein